MVNHRRRVDIIADILSVATHGAKKTQIMYRANLSYKVLQNYLSEVLNSSLIKFETANKNYFLTPKGMEFLSSYHDYHKMNSRVEEKLVEISDKRKSLEELCSGK
jgi:predicted transcriptional regulator